VERSSGAWLMEKSSAGRKRKSCDGFVMIGRRSSGNAGWKRRNKALGVGGVVACDGGGGGKTETCLNVKGSTGEDGQLAGKTATLRLSNARTENAKDKLGTEVGSNGGGFKEGGGKEAK